MSVDLGDINQDGRGDVYVANMFSKAGTRIMNGVGEIDRSTRQLMQKFVRGNTLFLSQPDGGYVDSALAQRRLSASVRWRPARAGCSARARA
jgi:hypothetical protein